MARSHRNLGHRHVAVSPPWRRRVATPRMQGEICRKPRCLGAAQPSLSSALHALRDITTPTRHQHPRVSWTWRKSRCPTDRHISWNTCRPHCIRAAVGNTALAHPAWLHLSYSVRPSPAGNLASELGEMTGSSLDRVLTRSLSPLAFHLSCSPPPGPVTE